MSRGGNTRRAVVNTVMNLTVALKFGDFFDERESAFEEGLCGVGGWLVA